MSDGAIITLRIEVDARGFEVPPALRLLGVILGQSQVEEYLSHHNHSAHLSVRYNDSKQIDKASYSTFSFREDGDVSDSE